MRHIDTQRKANYQDMGLIPYVKAWEVQKQTVAAVIGGDEPTLLLCEHPAVLTLGRLGAEDHILLSREALRFQDIEVIRIDRGGEVTLHSPDSWLFILFLICMIMGKICGFICKNWSKLALIYCAILV